MTAEPDSGKSPRRTRSIALRGAGGRTATNDS
jgi:hypothetical protein